MAAPAHWRLTRRCSDLCNFMRRLLLGLLCLSFSIPAFALGLGGIQGRAIIGRPLHVEIPIIGAEGMGEQALCARLIPEGEDADLVNITLRVERRKLYLSSTRGITQPVFRFRIRMGCPAFLEESYVVLADPPESPANSASSGFAPARNPGVADAVDRYTVQAATTLRLISRQRYPGNSSDRVRFIKRVAAANPELFDSEARAYDQALASGTELRMPDGLPKLTRPKEQPMNSRAVEPVERSRGKTAEKSAPVETKGKGRLVISGGTPAAGRGPSTAELSESLDRLTEAMNEQVKIELATIERLKVLENELLEFKRQAAAERAAMARLEVELKLMREQADRDSTTKLVLFILLGGLISAIGLRWMMDRHSKLRWTPLESAPAGNSTRTDEAAVQRKVQPLRQKSKPPEDDLEDILPPRK